MKWGDGLRVDTGALEAKASGIRQSHAGVLGVLQATRATDVGPWRGDAARAERSRRRRLIDSLQRQADVLPRAADALSDAAAAFGSLQSTQHRAIARAQSWQYRISDWGVVTSTAGLNLDPRRPFIRAQLQGTAITVTLRLTAADLELAARLGLLAVELGISGALDDLKNSVIDGGEWLGDKVLDGLDWTGERIRDAYEWGQDRVEDVVDWFRRGAEAAGPAWSRFLDTLGTKPRWLTDLLEHGEIPQFSEVAGQVLYLTGQLAGVGFDFVSGERNHFFDDGVPWVGEVTGHDQTNYGGVGDVMQTAMDVYGSHDQADPHDRASVQVTAVEGPDGTIRYIVAIPGTTEDIASLDGWSGSEAGTDWAANLKGVGYGSTSASEAAMLAVDKAIAADMAARGLTGTPQLLLTGHSQGGIIAANMAADPGFASRYDVRGIVSAGSPQQSIPVPSHVPVYNFQNTFDPVPRADFGGNAPANQHQIVLPHSGSYNITHTHSQEFYMEGIRNLESGQGSAPNQDHLDQMNQDLGGFFNGQTTGYRVEYGREVQP